MDKKLERHVEGPGGSVQRRLEKRTGRQGRGALLQPDLGVAILRFQYAVTTLSEPHRPRRSVLVRCCKKQYDLFIDAELGNAGDIQPPAVGGSSGQREDDLVARIALDRYDYPEPVPRYDFPAPVILKAGAGHTLDVGDRLRPVAKRIETEPFDRCRLGLRHTDGQNGNRKSGSNQI